MAFGEPEPRGPHLPKSSTRGEEVLRPAAGKGLFGCSHLAISQRQT